MMADETDGKSLEATFSGNEICVIKSLIYLKNKKTQEDNFVTENESSYSQTFIPSLNDLSYSIVYNYKLNEHN